MVLSASLPSTEQSRELRSCWLGPSHGEQGLIPDAGQLPHDYTSPGMLEGFGCRGVVGKRGWAVCAGIENGDLGCVCV